MTSTTIKDYCICGKDIDEACHAAHHLSPTSVVIVAWSCSKECDNATEALRVNGRLTMAMVDKARQARKAAGVATQEAQPEESIRLRRAEGERAEAVNQWPQTNTYTWYEFPGLAIECGGYRDMTIVNPATNDRLWLADVLDFTDGPMTLVQTFRKLADILEANPEVAAQFEFGE